MVVLIRCNDVVSDPRAMKYVKYLDDTKRNYTLIGWDREGKMQDTEKAIYYHHQAGYNVGGTKAIFNRIRWMWFVINTLLSLKIERLIIHACDLDAAFPAIIYKIITSNKQKCKVIFDIFDWFSATLNSESRLVLYAFKIMEKMSINQSDHIIICEPERIDQIPYDIAPHKVLILPNIPYFDNFNFLKETEDFKFNNSLITFSYVGGFTNTRCLSEIIKLAEKGIVNLLIAGFGNVFIQNKLSGLKDSPFIKYFGKVNYQKGLNISFNSDVVYAMYSKVVPNHVYAAPNKFYEAMFLGKPIFSTKGTILESKIEKREMGFVSDEDEKDIERKIKSITPEDIREKGANSRKYWNSEFCDYTKNFMESQYAKIISES